MKKKVLPLIHQLAKKYDEQTFCFVLEEFAELSEAKNVERLIFDSYFILIAEANFWEIYQGKTLKSLYKKTKTIVDSGFCLDQDVLDRRLGEAGFDSKETVNKTQIASLIIIKKILQRYEEEKQNPVIRTVF